MRIIGVSSLKNGQAGPKAAPRTDTERRVAAIWARVFEMKEVGRHDNFFELGGHSLLAARIAVQIREAFERPFPIITLFHAPTVAQLAEWLDEGLAWSPLAALQPEGTRPPFFCVHGAGGNTMELRALAQHLAPDQPLYGLEARGVDGRQPPVVSVEAMAADYLEEIRRVQPQGPYYVGGYSFGGLVALEMARRLQAEGESVGLLALLDSAVPFLAPQSVSQMLRRARRRVRSEWVGMRRMGARYLRHAFDHLWHYARWTAKLAFAIDLDHSSTPEGIIAASTQAWMAYRAEPYRGRAVLLRAESNAEVPPSRTWADVIPEGLRVRTVAGDHFELMKPPHVRPLAGMLADELAEAQALHEKASA